VRFANSGLHPLSVYERASHERVRAFVPSCATMLVVLAGCHCRQTSTTFDREILVRAVKSKKDMRLKERSKNGSDFIVSPHVSY